MSGIETVTVSRALLDELHAIAETIEAASRIHDEHAHPIVREHALLERGTARGIRQALRSIETGTVTPEAFR